MKRFYLSKLTIVIISLVILCISCGGESVDDSVFQPSTDENTDDDQIITSGLCSSDEQFTHVIITSQSFKESSEEYSLEALKEHRIENGMTSTIVTLEDIYKVYSGEREEEQIRNFVIDAYNIWGTKYLLIGGDTNVVPMITMYARSTSVLSDMYYGCLDGDFDANDNGVYGEEEDNPDFTYEVYVGRASADSESEISNFVYKTITYENTPLNAAFHTKMIQWNALESGVGDTTTWPAQYLALAPHITSEFYRLENDSDQATTITNDRLNSNNFGYYLGAAHGTFDSTATLSRESVLTMTNADCHFFFASIACLTGKLDRDCVAERLTTSTRTGAFAGFFNSVTAYAPYITQYLISMRNNHLTEGITRLGDLRSSLVETYELSEYASSDEARYQAYHFNLLGDPATDWKMAISKPIDLYMDLESGSTDHSGNGHILSLYNGASTSSQYLTLDGVDDYAQITHSKWNPMGAQVELTLSAKVNLNSIGSRMPIFTKGKTTTPFSLVVAADGKLEFSVNQSSPSLSNGSYSWSSNSSLTANTWHNVSVSLGYTSGVVEMYIDGKLDKSIDVSDYGIYLGSTQEYLYVGYDGVSDRFSGSIDDIAIFSKELNNTEITTALTTW